MNSKRKSCEKHSIPENSFQKYSKRYYIFFEKLVPINLFLDVFHAFQKFRNLSLENHVVESQFWKLKEACFKKISEWIVSKSL